MKLKKTNTILFLFIFGTAILSVILNNINVSAYKGNSWGKEYVVYSERGAYFYLDSETPTSIYNVPHNSELYCSNNKPSNDRLFCWFKFDYKSEPISGWVDSNLIILEE